jgi:hypothetical protein
VAEKLLQLPMILALAAVGVYSLLGALSTRFRKVRWGRRGQGGPVVSQIGHLAWGVCFVTFAFVWGMSLWRPIHHTVASWVLGSEFAFLMLTAMVDWVRHR